MQEFGSRWHGIRKYYRSRADAFKEYVGRLEEFFGSGISNDYMQRYIHAMITPEPQVLSHCPMNPLRKHMDRKCGSCGVPAPDGESKFCNRCGSAIIEEQPEPQLPVCSTCGMRVADPEAQFCDKCGGTVRKTMACPACGNPAIDENSKFCTRCGTTFAKPGTCPDCGFVNPEDAVFCNRCATPLKSQSIPTAPVAPAVVVAKKRTNLPVQEEPVADWDPWSDGGQEHDVHPAPPQANQYEYDYPSPQDTQFRAPQVRVPPKKYSHLPLIADELKDAKKPYTGPDEYSNPPSAKQRPGKKGVLGFLKK
jgi:predicted amidophosphoribosyltransferase